MLNWNPVKKIFNFPAISKPARPASCREPLWDAGRPLEKGCLLFPEKYFHEILQLEQKRTERSGGFFSLILLDMQKLFQIARREDVIIRKMIKALFSSTRETDIKGWYEYNTAVGVLFTGISKGPMELIVEKIKKSLHDSYGENLAEKIEISFHSFPQSNNGPGQIEYKAAPGLARKGNSKNVPRFFKRMLDISGSLLLLIMFFPLFILIPLLIKITSDGPVFFRQQRIGFRGIPFTFFKFRSMYVNNADAIHREFVKDFIKGNTAVRNGGEKGTYKIKTDPRVTPVGKFLRKSSLDELPQFINVLKGEMSLVGPRPPIPYEVKDYDVWHMRRITDIKPGITGLWQVSGRSRTSFDEMVRLDLRYARTWSLWMDIMILLRTPLAVFAGKGAY